MAHQIYLEEQLKRENLTQKDIDKLLTDLLFFSYDEDLKNAKKIQINYANNSHYKSQLLNKYSALRYADVDNVICYNINDIDEDFKNKNKEILECKKGAGYWLWKPYLILKTLKDLNDDEYLIYCDSSVIHLKSWFPVIELMYKLKTDIGCFEIIQLEKMWTKRDLFINMDLDDKDYTDTYQRCASYQIIKKNDFTLKFYKEYLELCCRKENITDSPSKRNKNYDCFKEHRHDQSIFSLLTKKYNIPCLRDPCQFRFEGDGGISKAEGSYGQLLNHHRSKY
jgi:hypothetical protein